MAAPFGSNPVTSAPSGASGEGAPGSSRNGRGGLNIKQPPTQRPGGIPGSTSGADGDEGRDGLADALPGDRTLPPHTGY